MQPGCWHPTFVRRQKKRRLCFDEKGKAGEGEFFQI
jgi:hypothetical protein